MVANFELSERLRLFLQVGSRYKVLTLGDKLPVSIRKRYSSSQSIYIYPELDYDFFISNEVMCFFSLAKGLQLDACIRVENGVPVIEISDWSLNDK